MKIDKIKVQELQAAFTKSRQWEVAGPRFKPVSSHAEAGRLSIPEYLCSVTIIYVRVLAGPLFLSFIYLFSSVSPENYQLDLNSIQFSQTSYESGGDN